MAMLVSHISRFVVGIEAHSGVGDMKKSFYWSRRGIVIGETAEIVNGVLIYKCRTTLEGKKDIHILAVMWT